MQKRLALHVNATNSLPEAFSQDDDKIALVSPLDRGTSKNNDISNGRPISILTTFSKKY